VLRIFPRHTPNPCKRPRCRTCSNFITSSTVTINTANGWYTLNPNGTCHTSNVIYILTCKFCDAFFVGETSCALNIRINNYSYFCTINKLDVPVSLYTESHNTSFDLSFLVAIIHILPPSTSTSTRFIHGLNAKYVSLTLPSITLKHPFPLHFQHISFYDPIVNIHALWFPIFPRSANPCTI